MNIIEFLEEHDACDSGVDWVKAQPDQSIEALWKTCDDGSWMLWFHEACAADFNTLAPVVYRAINRALRHAEKALDDAGIDNKLKLSGLTVTDQASAAEAARVANWIAISAVRATSAAEAAWVAVRAAEATSAAEAARVAVRAAEATSAARAARVAVRAAEAEATSAARAAEAEATSAARAAELKQIADDCRELLPVPKMEAESDLR